MGAHRVYRGIGVCRVLSSDEESERTGEVVIEPVTAVGTPPRIRIPRDRLADMTRDLVSRREAEEVLDLLREAPEPLSSLVWTRRRRAYEEAVKEGVLSELAGHLRDLAGKNPLSHAERVLRDRLRAMVADELALVLGKSRPQALDLLAEAQRASLEKR